MKNNIFKLNKSRTGDDSWEVFTFTKLNPPSEDLAVNECTMQFTSNIKTAFLLGEYRFANLVVEIGLMQLYDEDEDSIGLRFIIGNECIESHGILRNNEETAILTDRDGSAIGLSFHLKSDFYHWLQKIESTVTWDN